MEMVCAIAVCDWVLLSLRPQFSVVRVLRKATIEVEDDLARRLL